MKKIVIILAMALTYAACSPSDVVSERTVKAALEIAQAETKDLEWTGYAYDSYSLLKIKDYLINQSWRNNMECSILDMSDVNGVNHVRACLLRGVNTKGTTPSESKDVLVMAEQDKTNKDMVLVMFFNDAKKTEKGYKCSTLLPVGAIVNLKTRKIGQL